MADNDNLITTIGIGVDVKSDKALKSLDDIVRKLQSLGNVTLSKKFATNLDALAESLKKFKVSGKFDPTASLKKISSAIAQLKDAKSAIIPASVYNNIAKLGDSLKGITDADISRLERLADALLKMKDLSGFKFPSMGAVRKATSASQDKQLPAIFGGRQMPSLYEGTTQSGFKDIEKDSNIIEGTFKEIPRDLTASLLPASALEDLALRIYNNFGKIGDAVSKAKSELMAIGNAVKVTSVAIGKFAGGMMLAPWRAIGSTIGNATKRLSGFLSALKRIAIYRAIRTALKEITQGFKEGMQNLYQYSVLIDGKFKESMDSLATSALYAKNSLGAMSAPIVNVLAPAVDMPAVENTICRRNSKVLIVKQNRLSIDYLPPHFPALE